MASSGDAAMMLGADFARLDLPWWAFLVIALATIARTTFSQMCCYLLGKRVLDLLGKGVAKDAPAQDLEKVTRAVMEGVKEGQNRWWGSRKGSNSRDLDPQ
ncbi:hypothetical protein [Nocardia otitidiscaviarum]|uniref:hypothetical protein n=1 Tax=Nocardia otitidiscaviarum TaxID=1823 RepID=UPI002455A654|nr:hypothetical protein [Nocardia otitidiscaviarum]